MTKLAMLAEEAREKHVSERLFTFEQASEVKNLGSKYTIARWVRLGRLPVVRLGRRSLRLRESDIDRFIQANLVPARESAR